MGQTLKIDFVADVVCPWCYIGWARLKTAMATLPEMTPEVMWRPFQLDPAIPEEGVDRAAYMAAKFPNAERRAQALEALNKEAEGAGLTLHLDKIPVSPNTNAAHRLIRWAAGVGLQQEAMEAVMKAYFTDLRDIGDPLVLSQIAEEIGMDRLKVLEAFSGEADKDAVTREHVMAAQAGVTGVPFMIFDGKIAVHGAETPERLARAITTALAEQTA